MRSERTGASLCVVAFLLLAGTPCASGQSQRMRAVRPPVQRSSEERIDAALAAGQIDSETALLYKVFAAFGDCRLPASLAGDAGPLMDSMIIAEVRARFSQLSAATKATLQPFLLAPGVHGSWVELESNCYNRRFAKGSLGVEVTPTVDWITISAENAKATVRYRKDRPEDAGRAQVMKQALDRSWTKLTGFFQTEPVEDTGAEFGDLGDGRIDIYLTPIEEPGQRETVGGVFHSAGCGSSTGYITMNTALPDSDLDDRLRIAHELTHAITASFGGGACDDYRWLTEATGVWGEHFVYPEIFTRRGASSFLSDPNLPLETRNGIHEYGAYLFLFFLELGLPQPSLIRLIWENSKQADSLVNIDGVLNAEQRRGFQKVWPMFVRYNWNQEPVDDYHRWDPLPTAFALTARETLNTKINSDEKSAEAVDSPKQPLHHLSAQYFRLRPFMNGSSVLFLNGWTFKADKNAVDIDFQPVAYTSVPLDDSKKTDTIQVEALEKVNGKWTKHVNASHWTDKSFVAYCRDRSDERLEELVIIVSNSEFHDRNKTYEPGQYPLVLFESNIACGEWQGVAEMDWNWDEGALLTQKAVNLSWKRVSAEAAQMPYKNGTAVLGYDFVASGTIAWSGHGAVEPPCCTASGDGTVDAAQKSLMTTFNFLPIGSSLYRRYSGAAGATPPPMVPVSCQCDPPVTEPPIPLFTWWVATTEDEQRPLISNDGKMMQGQIGTVLKFTWNFTASGPQ